MCVLLLFSDDRGRRDLGAWEKALGAVSSVIDSASIKTPFYKSIFQAAGKSSTGDIDWSKVRNVAVSVSRLDGVQEAVPEGSERAQMEEMAQKSKQLILDFTGLKVSRDVGSLYAVTREGWIDENVKGFELLFELMMGPYKKAVDRFVKRTSLFRRGYDRLMTSVITVQIGIVMGYLSRNILGHFDLALPSEEGVEKILIVVPNLFKVENELELNAESFRFWIVLHEMTHAVQFASTSWMRSFMIAIIKEYLENAEIQLENLASRFGKKEFNLSDIAEALNRGGLMGIVVNEEQEKILKRIQAFMSMIEGYGNFVMDMIGERAIDDFDRMRELFRLRKRNKSGPEKMLEKMLGFDLKLQQYELGELFCREVAEKEGVAFLNLLWKDPYNIPFFEELRRPYNWIERMKSQGKGLMLAPGKA